MPKITENNYEIYKYVDDAVAKLEDKITLAHEQIRQEVKKDYAIKLVESIVFSFCALILIGVVGWILAGIGLKK